MTNARTFQCKYILDIMSVKSHTLHYITGIYYMHYYLLQMSAINSALRWTPRWPRGNQTFPTPSWPWGVVATTTPGFVYSLHDHRWPRVKEEPGACLYGHEWPSWALGLNYCRPDIVSVSLSDRTYIKTTVFPYQEIYSRHLSVFISCHTFRP